MPWIFSTGTTFKRCTVFKFSWFYAILFNILQLIEEGIFDAESGSGDKSALNLGNFDEILWVIVLNTSGIAGIKQSFLVLKILSGWEKKYFSVIHVLVQDNLKCNQTKRIYALVDTGSQKFYIFRKTAVDM